MNERTFIISIMTRDRVGIVADVTGAIKDLGGNLADLSQTVLSGYFTMILVASLPEDIAESELRRRLSEFDSEVPLEVGVQMPTAPLPADPSASEGQYVVTAVGIDQTGLVAAISEYLRDAGVNIYDFTTLVADGRYTMILSIDLPGTDIADFKFRLRGAMQKVGVSVELQHRRIFVATNEI